MRVHVDGAAGYAGLEIVRLLLAHPALESGVLQSRSHAGEAIADHAPLLRTSSRRFAGPGAIAQVLKTGDCVVTAGSPESSRMAVPAYLEAGARVIDLSSAYRDDDRAVYGFAGLYREQIARADLVANPGCYPTATLLATLPLAAFDPQLVLVDAKSGVTGAGKNPSVAAMFAEVYGDVRAYGLQGHRHEPEIERQWRAAGIGAALHFTPHVVPIARGMLVNASAVFAQTLDPDLLAAAFEVFYRDDPFVQIRKDAPSLPSLAGTNNAQLHVSCKNNVARVLCAIDNLGKGAAAQAVANINLMYGYPEALGLATTPITC